MVFPQGTSICLTGGRGTGKSVCTPAALPSHVSGSLILPDSTSSIPGQAVGAPGRWGTLRGVAPWASSPPPLAGVGADVQAGRRLLHKPKKRSPVLFLVQPRSVEALVLLARPVFRGWLEPSHRVKCLVAKASEPKHFKSRVLWIHDFMVLSLKAGRLN